MDVNAQSQNQSYWLLFREDQSNVIFSSNNFTIQNPTQITAQEARYIVSTGDTNRQYIQINEAPTAAAPQELPEPCEVAPEADKQKEEDNFWDRNKIVLLLTLCLENKVSSAGAGGGGSKESALWDTIAATVGTTADECNKKYRNLRRTYIRLLKKKKMGRHVKWVHFNLCNEIYNEYRSPTLLEPWEDFKIRRLLNLYIENLHRFRNTDCVQKDIWREIADQLGSTEYSCYHKFKNLKRAYLTWLERSREGGKVVKKWPYQHYFERIFYNYSPGLKPWDRFQTKRLLDAYAQYSHKFQNPKFQKKELWKEISTMVGKSPIDCDRKYRNLKQTYLKLKSKIETSRHKTNWRFYKDLEAIYSSSPEPSTSKSTVTDRDDYISTLLQFYVDHKVKFRDPLTKNKSLWKLISPKLGMSPEECDRKFRNLKQTYIRLAERNEPGQQIKWPYFSYFHKIYGTPDTPQFERENTEIPTVKDIQEKENDRKFERLLNLVEESNCIQRERNRILQALISQK